MGSKRKSRRQAKAFRKEKAGGQRRQWAKAFEAEVQAILKPPAPDPIDMRRDAEREYMRIIPLLNWSVSNMLQRLYYGTRDKRARLGYIDSFVDRYLGGVRPWEEKTYVDGPDLLSALLERE